MNDHLTSQQVSDWRSGVSGAEELLRLDDHLAECAACRAQVSGSIREDAGLAIRMLRAEFSAAHLTEAQLDDYAAHRPLPADVMQHLDLCEPCRLDAAELRLFANEIEVGKPPVSVRRGVPVWVRSLAAAVAFAALGLSVWFAMHKSGAPRQETVVSNIPPSYPAQYMAEVQAAMDSGLQIPASIAGLTAGPIQLRSVPGSETKPAFHLISPLATAVVEDTPVFRWTPLEGAGTTFTVSVFDDRFHAVATGVSADGAEWRPDKPLARGATYRWEVRAVKGKHVDLAPAPTEPEARFAVLGAVEARRLDEARSAMPHSPLALGILYADSGVIGDATRELADAAASSDPKQKSASERLLGQLKKMSATP